MNSAVITTTTALAANVDPMMIERGMKDLERCLFPVAETELLYATGEKGQEMINTDKAHKVIVRTDENKVVGVHTNSYHLVPNRDVFIPLLSALFSSGINTEGMYVRVSCPYGGEQTIVTYHFPHEVLKISDNDALHMTITIVNSYNGVWAFRADLGAYRLICSNGARIGGKMLDIYARHTSGLDVDKAVQALSDAMETFKANETVWKKWALRVITTDQARAVLENAAFLSGKALEDVLDRFEKEGDRLGRHSVWALYNGLTEWATHAKTRNQGEDGEAIQYKRQEQVFRFTEGKNFLALADAA